jgi:molybdenum cofactor cytidylyltransferase
MGSPKQLIEIGGRPLVALAAEAALGSTAWPVVVVLGANAERIRPALARLPVLVVENPAWAEGMASSIRTGIGILRQFSRSLEGAVIALCDQPAFSAETVSRLVEAQGATGRSIATARYDGHFGAPALFLSRHFAALEGLTGDEGARSLVHAAPGDVAAVDMPELELNLDTPADLERLANLEAQRAGPLRGPRSASPI